MLQVLNSFRLLKKIPQLLKVSLLFCVLIANQFPLFSQAGENYTDLRARLVASSNNRYIDDAFGRSINQFYYRTCDSLIQENLVIDGKPIKQILTRYFDTCLNKINSRTLATLQLPALNRNFLQTLAVASKGSVTGVYKSIPVTQTDILQLVFNDLSIGDSIENYARLREMIHDPFLISSRIQLPQYQVYRDTLLYLLANGAPRVLAEKLARGDRFYMSLVESSNNKTVLAVAAIKAGNYYDLILPFSMAIWEKRITVADIKELALVPRNYYHAFAMEAIRLHNSSDPEMNSFLNATFSELNKKFANHYFIKEINELHELPGNIRFKVLDQLPAVDLYFLLLGGGSELMIGGSSALYTSSFLYVYHKFLAGVSTAKLNAFMEDIGYFQFDRFISNISDYGLVDDIVHHLPEAKLVNLIENYLEALPDVQHTDNTIILTAMTLAEILYETRHHRDLGLLLTQTTDRLKLQFARQENFMYQRIYEGFRDILMNNDNYLIESNYEILKKDHLVKNDNIVQVSFFYDDEDAVSSFNSYLLTFPRETWSKKDFGNYIVLRSVNGNNMSAYMNKPFTEKGCEASQLEMLRAIEQENLEVTSFIHRGHSYHLPASLAKFKPSAKFVFLGSCGGYNQVLQVFQLNPDVQIISTRGVSSKLINDPLLEKINAAVVTNKDIIWDEFWQGFRVRFQSPQLNDLFSSYIPPNKYIGVKYIRNVFNF